MLITSLEYLGRSKVRIYMDGEFAFPLMREDIIQYDLKEGLELSKDAYELILGEGVLRRAKLKALAILKYMDRSEQELRKKLMEAEYPKDVIDMAIDYVKGYGYIDDSRYASSYIRHRKNTKSKSMLTAELYNKGIRRDIIETALTLEYNLAQEEDPELIAIKKVLTRKSIIPEDLTWEEKQKLLASLYRKGFDIEKIKQVLKK